MEGPQNPVFRPENEQDPHITQKPTREEIQPTTYPTPEKEDARSEGGPRDEGHFDPRGGVQGAGPDSRVILRIRRQSALPQQRFHPRRRVLARPAGPQGFGPNSGISPPELRALPPGQIRLPIRPPRFPLRRMRGAERPCPSRDRAPEFTNGRKFRG